MEAPVLEVLISPEPIDRLCYVDSASERVVLSAEGAPVLAILGPARAVDSIALEGGTHR